MDPVLSVILVVGKRRYRSGQALKSVLGQSMIDRMEVLLMECGPPGISPLAGSDHPSVRLLHLEPEVGLTQARTRAVRLARAPVVAFIEDHSLALPGWAEALVRAHGGPWAGVGYEIHHGNPNLGFSNASALLDHAPWIPPAAREEATFLPGYNSAYKRDILLGYAERLPLLLRSDTLLQWKLKVDGHRLLVEPGARIARKYHTTPYDICSCLFWWNRSMGAGRAELFAWSVARKALYIALTPIIPWIRSGRLFLFIVRRRRRWIGEFLRNIPIIVAGQYASALGHASGLLLGIGEAEARSTELELTTPRGLEDVQETRG